MGRSPPFPQLLPDLNQSLHLPRTRKAVVNETAILIGPLIEVPNRSHAEVREAVTEFLRLLLAQYLPFLAIRTPGHGQSSYHFRVLFAYNRARAIPA